MRRESVIVHLLVRETLTVFRLSTSISPSVFKLKGWETTSGKWEEDEFKKQKKEIVWSKTCWSWKKKRNLEENSEFWIITLDW